MEMAEGLGIVFFNITGISRQGLDKPEYVANDGLHPSGIQYTEWVKLILTYIDNNLTSTFNHNRNSIEEISISPNPTSGNIKVDLPESISSQIYRTQLYNVSGSKLLDNTCYEKTINLSIDPFPDGLYFLKITAGSFQSISKILKTSEAH